MTNILQLVTDTFDKGFRSHQDGDVETAKRCYLEVLKTEPEHADALHLLGNIDLSAGQLEDAERLIRKAISIKPRDAGYYNSLGRLLQQKQELDEARETFEKALEINPGFDVAMNNLGTVYQEQGNLHDALAMYDRAIASDALFLQAHNNRGRVLNNLRRHEEAIEAFQQAVKVRPDFSEAYNNIGHVQRAKGDMKDALESFLNAIRIDPEYAQAWHNLGTAYMELNQPVEALRAFAKSVELDPNDALALTNLGVLQHMRGQLQEAIESYSMALKLSPDDASIYSNLGVVYSEQRENELAESAYRQALELDPAGVDAVAQLAALYEENNRLDEAEIVVDKGMRIEPLHPLLNLQAAKLARRRNNIDAAIDMLSKLDVSRLIPRLAQQYHYEMGRLLDRKENSDAAYDHLTQGNELARNNFRMRQIDPNRFLNRIDVAHTLFSKTDIAKWTPSPAFEQRQPVFLIGFPRSGTTLTEIMLDNHPGITTIEEKPTMDRVRFAVSKMPGGYPGALPSLKPEQVERLRGIYLDALAGFAGADSDDLIIDKSAGRMVQTGLIWRLFPDARFVFVVRHPCDACLSGFMQQFTLNNDAFANFFNLDEATALYDKSMSLWRVFSEVLPIRCHTIRYEDLVEDTKKEMRALLKFLDMPWDDAVLNYQQRALERGSVTPSYHQVTEPIYRHALNRWHRYRGYLEPYINRLSSHAEYLGYSMS